MEKQQVESGVARLLARLLRDRIDNVRLADLICEHSEKMRMINPKVLNPKTGVMKTPDTKDCRFIPMGEELGAYLVAIVEKLSMHRRFKNYTPDWKKEMKSRAYDHLTKYIWRNFDREKLLYYTNRKGELVQAKKDAAYSYVAQIVGNAFKQVSDMYNKEREREDEYNDDYGVNYSELEEKIASAFNAVIPDENRLDYGLSITE